MISFHTPKLPAPLGLDLASLKGGGSCPSQFYGKTHDGLDVYVRYRGGTLEIHLGREPGDDPLNDGNCILEADVGPFLDGSISLTQFCTNFGVTINAVIPGETDPDAHRYTDLSGQTTFWNAYLSQVTIETARKILRKAGAILPHALLVKPVVNNKYRLDRLEQITPDHIDTSNVWLIDGPSHLAEIATSPDEFILPRSDQLLISINYSSWEYPAPKYTSLLRLIEKELGQTFFIAGERDMPKEIEITTDALSMRARFDTKDQVMREKLTRLSKMISEQFPITALELVDLATGNLIESTKGTLDPVIANWCKAGADRWLEITTVDRNGHLIGVRPARI